MSEQIAKLNIEEKLIACIELAQKRQADIQALRADNQRLKEALQGMVKLVDDGLLVRNVANDAHGRLGDSSITDCAGVTTGERSLAAEEGGEMKECRYCVAIEQGRKRQRERKGCDLCKQDRATYRFEHIGGPLALWFCAGCYTVLTGAQP